MLDNLGRLIGAYADKTATAELPAARTAGDVAPRLDEQKRNRRLRRVIIAAAILSVLAGRACSERQSVAPPPAPSPPRAGALEDAPAAPRLAAGFGLDRRASLGLAPRKLIRFENERDSPPTVAGTTYLKAVVGPIIEAMPSVGRWPTAVGEREAVKRGISVPKV
ncbi:MAG TPA: hypothetical protein VJY34_16940 [Roseiarcus sp.]|nr:hypothetical protein [Roseiarcus sp.]